MIFFINLFTQKFNSYGAKGTFTGNTLGVKVNPHVEQNFKGKIQKHQKLPSKVSFAQVEKMKKDADEAHQNAINMRNYRKHLEKMLTALKDSYKDTAEYKAFYMKIVAEIHKIDEFANKSIGLSIHHSNVADAGLAGFQAAANAAAEFRP